MARLEDITRGTSIKGVLPDALVMVVDVKWIGTVAIELTYKDPAGQLGHEWQDELYGRFHLDFEILTNDALEAARTGNWFAETGLAIARLDKLSRNPDVQAKLEQTDWDLIVCDEAHKMSATYFGNEVSYTKRYRLGQLLSTLTRHFLLLTATPHNGKEADFQLFMALLDGDRFEGKFRDGMHTADVSDSAGRDHRLGYRTPSRPAQTGCDSGG